MSLFPRWAKVWARRLCWISVVLSFASSIVALCEGKGIFVAAHYGADAFPLVALLVLVEPPGRAG